MYRTKLSTPVKTPQKSLEKPSSKRVVRYETLWRKKSTKKHKSWQGDAIASLKDDKFLITDGKKVLATFRAEKITEGAELQQGAYEFEIGTKLEESSTETNSNTAIPIVKDRGLIKSGLGSPKSSSHTPARPFIGLANQARHKRDIESESPQEKKPKMAKNDYSLPCYPDKVVKVASSQHTLHTKSETLEKHNKGIYSRSCSQFKPGLSDSQRSTIPTVDDVDVSRDSPQDTQPTGDEPQGAHEESMPFSQDLVESQSNLPVKTLGVELKGEPKASMGTNELVIDEILSSSLRPHQEEAVQFLYKSIQGVQHCYGNGAILAHSMGLGKTLTAIALCHSMVRQHLLETVLIACPASLVKNWRNEFDKWLPKGSIGIFVASPGCNLTSFCNKGLRRVYPIMICGYERLRGIANEISENMGEFDLIICDEGHRLKSSESKIWSALGDISGSKRIVMTGTPSQNKLEEFWSIAEFVNPGVFGASSGAFSSKYSNPIQAARNAEASQEVRVLGQAKMLELVEITNEFCLRKDASVLEGHLNIPKQEHVVFCQPTDTQMSMYNLLLTDSLHWLEDQNFGAKALKLITTLKKVSNAPALLSSESSICDRASVIRDSGKLIALEALLKEISHNTDEKVVIVSGSMGMLDLANEVCKKLMLGWLRLDGSTPVDKRQALVNLFNNTPKERSFAFLLSGRAGGVGLNLIGASRLILLDCDWNPAIDLQAMARIHRDGQKRSTFVYRLMTTGMIDEKIFQRQLEKLSLCDSIFDMETNSKDQFTKEQLKQIFKLSRHTTCDTVEQGPITGYTILDKLEDNILEQARSSSGVISCVLSK